MTRQEIMTAAARHIERLGVYAGDVCCVDSGANASDPVMIFGRQGWTSTPFQNADFSCVRLANWLYSEGGCPSYLAEIGRDGSATLYGVDTDQGDDTYDSEVEEVETLPAYCWLDRAMLATIQGAGDFAHGGDIPCAVESWLDADFDAAEAGEWLAAGVFDADAARQLADADIEPEQVDVPSETLPGYTLGYAYANGDATFDEVIDAIGVEG